MNSILQWLIALLQRHEHTGVDGTLPLTARSFAGGAIPSGNLLVNGGFEIWQRGTSFPNIASNAFGPDRWQHFKGGTSTLTVTREASVVDSGSQFSSKLDYNHNSQSSVYQRIEGAEKLRGLTLALSVRVHCSVANCVRVRIDDSSGPGVAGDYHSGNGTWQTLTATKTISTSATSVTAAILLEATSSAIYLDNAMLIVGSAPSAYVPLPLPEEAARCLRYYERRGGSNVYERFGSGGSTSVTYALFHFQYVASKATTPSITLSAPNTFSVINGVGTLITPTNVIAASIGPQTCSVEASATGGFVAGQFAILIANNTTNALIAIEANP